jgi:hypothetical protein
MKEILIGILMLANFSHLEAQSLFKLTGHVIFNETGQEVPHLKISVLSSDLLIDTTIVCDKNGVFKVTLPAQEYIVEISGDSLTGGQMVKVIKDTNIELKAYYDIQNDYKIFQKGFNSIYEGLSTIGFKDDLTFRRITFVDNYATYSFIENGTYRLSGDTIITKTLNIECYDINLVKKYVDRLESYVMRKDTSSYLLDQNKNKYRLTTFEKLNSKFEVLKKEWLENVKQK